VVKLKNGGFVRGTIAELIPNGSVTIVTVTGETERFAMSEVDYAGPYSKPIEASVVTPPPPEPVQKAPTPGPVPLSSSIPPTKAAEDVVEVQFDSDPVGVTFYEHSALNATIVAPGLLALMGYNVICTAPCKAELPAGTHALAMSYKESGPQEGTPVQLKKGAAHLHGDLVSRSGTRAGGFVVGLTGVVSGMVLFVLGASRTKSECVGGDLPCQDMGDPNMGMIFAGMGITAVGAAIGIYLITRRDKFELSVSAPDATSRAQSATDRRPPITDAHSAWRIPQSPGANLLRYSWQF
jgi:hypothetical protein